MKPFVQITRHLYEEPDTLNLVIIACNGRTMGCLEFYLRPADLEEIGNAFLQFPVHEKANYLFERGSERKEDNFGYFLKLQVTSPGGLQNRFTLQFHFNNNKHLREYHFPDEPQLTQFGFVATSEEIRQLGSLFSKFSKLKEHRLFWSQKYSYLDNELSNLSSWNTDTVANAFSALPK
jgi:hypothetical protein